MRIPFIAGNWKMFKTKEEARLFAEEFKTIYKYKGCGLEEGTDVKAAICAPFTNLEVLKKVFEGTGIGVGAQNLHFEDEGAFTGEISLQMLEEIGVEYCIVGHSERRQYFSETNETVNKKLKKLFESKIIPIFCVGEVLEEREEGIQNRVVKTQIVEGLKDIEKEDVAKLVIAYEPVWAIGTGKTATPKDAEDMCKTIRDTIEDIYDEDIADLVIIQYGGSVKPANAGDIMNMADIDGALVGGASLVPKDFNDIIDF